jgi:hypothetical protein
MLVRIAGKRMYLWRAVDHEGEVLDMLVQRRRDSGAALRLMRKLLKKQGFAPKLLATRPENPVRTGLVWGFFCQAVVLGWSDSFLFGAGKAVFRPVACNQVPGARGRGQGTETLAELGGLPP